MKNNLYYIQESDRPMYVIANSYEEAFNKWVKLIRKENNMTPDEEVEPPLGIQFIAEENDIIL